MEPRNALKPSSAKYRFAIATGWTDTDQTSTLLGALRPCINQHYATFTNPEDITILMKSIKAYPYTIVQCFRQSQTNTE